jgi:hypothetical protein
MSNLLSLNNQFVFNLPDDFIPEELEKDYLTLIKNFRSIYKTVIDYLNSTILSISFPGLTLKTVSNPQITKRKILKYKSVDNIHDLYDETVTITFLNTDSNLNYFIMQNIISSNYLNVQKTYDKPVMVTTVDKDRKGIFQIKYNDVMFLSVSDNTFSNNDSSIQNKNFTVTFTYNLINTELLLTNKDFINNSIK